MRLNMNKISNELTVEDALSLFWQTGLRWILENGKIMGYEIQENGE